MRVINIEAALQANSMAAMSQCIANQSNPFNDSQTKRRISLLDLRPEDMFCENQSFGLVSNIILSVSLILTTNMFELMTWKSRPLFRYEEFDDPINCYNPALCAPNNFKILCFVEFYVHLKYQILKLIFQKFTDIGLICHSF